MQPINYLSNAQNPMQSYLEGLKFGQDIRATQEALALDEKKKLFQADLLALQAKPTGNGMLNLMMKYPDFAKSLEPIQKAYSSAEKQGELSQLMQIDNALANGNAQLALDLSNTAKKALTNTGESTEQIDTIIKLITNNDTKGAQGTTSALLASVLGDKYKSYAEAQTINLERPKQAEKLQAEIEKLKAQGKFEEAKALGEQLKNQGTITGQNQTKLAPGILQASTSIAQNDIESAKRTLDTEMEYAQKMGMPTFVYRQALDFLDKGDTKGAKNVLDTSMLETYGKDWKDIIEGQTKSLTQESTVLEAKSKATTASVEAKYAPIKAQLEVELKNLEKKKIKAQTTEAQVGTAAQQEKIKLTKIEIVGKLNDVGTKLNENAGSAKTSYDTIDRLSVTSKNLNNKFEIEKKKTFPSTGTVMGRFPTISDVSQGIVNDIDNIKSEVALLQAKIHKGELTPMSDTDVSLLANATNSLSERNSPAENQRQLKVINTIIKNYEKNVQKTTGLDKFQADNYKPHIHQKVDLSGKPKSDPLKLFK